MYILWFGGLYLLHKYANKRIYKRYYPLVISFTNPELAGLYDTYKLMNCDISDITYHEIHTNLPLSLYNIGHSY